MRSSIIGRPHLPMKRTLRLIILLTAIPLAGLIVQFLYLQVAFARIEAASTQCKNNLFQHSSSHPIDRVWIDRSFHVLGVGSCPLCSDPSLGISFEFVDDRSSITLMPDNTLVPTGSMLPDETIEDGKSKLWIYKHVRRWRERRQSFHPDKNEYPELTQTAE